MNDNLTQRTLIEQIKFIIKQKKITITNLADEFNKLQNTNYVQSSFSRKLNKGNFNLNELQRLGDILGFEVELKLKAE